MDAQVFRNTARVAQATFKEYGPGMDTPNTFSGPTAVRRAVGAAESHKRVPPKGVEEVLRLYQEMCISI